MIIPIKKATQEDAPTIGSKGANLARLMSLGYRVPQGFCISTEIYRRFLDTTGLNYKISTELSRGDMDSMRWEELWDTSLRIRNFFNTTSLPEDIRSLLMEELKACPLPTVVRSSAPGEDSGSSSFAGLHESYIGIEDREDILDKIKLVWASLWSDSALLYRRELDLDIHRSSMGVIVQEMIVGEVSGVAFSKNPLNGEDKIIIEAVAGLNQKLVDGDTEPCRWMIDRKDGAVESLTESKESTSSLLDNKKLEILSNTLNKLEKQLGFPVDLEWTFQGDILYLLQARPITTFSCDNKDEKPWEKEDKRPWYRSLTLTFTALEKLQSHIEKEVFPNINKTAAELQSMNLEDMTEEELISEIKRRRSIYRKWSDIYWKDLIPFAHGVRLFAKIYNDTMKPEDPYEFTRLLSSGDLLCMKRNSELTELFFQINSNVNIRRALIHNQLDKLDLHFREKLEAFFKKYASSTFSGKKIFTDNSEFIGFLLKSSKGFNKRIFSSPKELEDEFLSRFKSMDMKKILELARVSWKFRDDDNLYLGMIETRVLEAVNYRRERFKWKGDIRPDLNHTFSNSEKNSEVLKVSVRRFTGQPASPGIGSGSARIILSPKELFQFKKGEVLVCDSLDPNMTFIVPLASAIVEQRGGMLIHGAIISREYGIPCVTGIQEAVNLIKQGDYIIVDGYSGTVSISDL